VRECGKLPVCCTRASPTQLRRQRQLVNLKEVTSASLPSRAEGLSAASPSGKKWKVVTSSGQPTKTVNSAKKDQTGVAPSRCFCLKF